MILGITNIGNGELAVIGLGVLGLFLVAHLGRRFIDLWIDSMRRHNEASWSLREYQNKRLTEQGREDRDYPDGDEDTLAPDADTYGEHARLVQPATAVEATGFLPRVAALPVDDTAAVDSVTGLGDGR